MFDWLFGSKTKLAIKNIEKSLGESIRLTQKILRRMTVMSAALDKLRQEVAENTAAVASAEALISGLAQQLRDAIGDEAALQALADELDANSARLAAAVSANTPGEAAEDDGIEEPEVTDDEPEAPVDPETTEETDPGTTTA